MKTILVLLLLTISIHGICQKVTYDNLIGTSWKLLDLAKTINMVFKFVDSKNLSQKSWDARYQPFMETIISYSLDTTSTPTLLHVDWKGEIMNCTECYISVADSLLIIQNIINPQDNSELKKAETLKKTLVFKMQSQSNTNKQ
jgi:hypothetical protein